MRGLLQATVRAGWESPVLRLARNILSPRTLLWKGREERPWWAWSDKVRHGAAVHPCRLHVVFRKE